MSIHTARKKKIDLKQYEYKVLAYNLKSACKQLLLV
jgi:hypothetical protein